MNEIFKRGKLTVKRIAANVPVGCNTHAKSHKLQTAILVCKHLAKKQWNCLAIEKYFLLCQLGNYVG